MRGHWFSCCAAVVVGALAALTPVWTPGAVAASGPVVTSCADSGPGSLRQAVADAASGDLVTFSVPANCTTIVLTTGAIDIDKNLTVRGPGASKLAISGGGNSGEVVVESSAAHVNINSLTLEDGGATGLVNASRELVAKNLVITGNRNAGDGGGILNTGRLDATDVSVTDNTSSEGNGGGIENEADSGLDMTGGDVSGNSAVSGGGVANAGSATLSNTVSGNTATQSGGGIYNTDFATADGTISDNAAECAGATPAGGGIYSSGELNLAALVTGNDATAPACSRSGGGGVAASGGLVGGGQILHNATSGDGGGIWIGGGSSASLEDSAVAYNAAQGSGGGIFSAGAFSLTTSTVTANVDNVGNSNRTGRGNGIYADGGDLTQVTLAMNGPSVKGDAQRYATASTTLVSTIVTKCSGPISDGGNNLSSDPDCDVTTASYLGLDPAGPQADGATVVIALLYDSPARGAGGTECNGWDQRGVRWHYYCDVGAYQSGPFTTTSLTLSATPNPAPGGHRIVFVATLNQPDRAGSVAFDADGKPIAGCSRVQVTVTADGSHATARCVGASLPPGTHTVDAAYLGGVFTKPAHRSTTVHVDKLVLASSRNPVPHGVAVTFTARIAGSDGGGTVRFTSGGATISGCGAVALTATGAAYTAKCRTSALKVGSHVIKAAYGGDKVSAATSASLTQKVT